MGVSPSMQLCIDNCTKCYQACVRTISHCLEKGGLHADNKHIQLLQDCARICEVSASFMIRESSFHASTCDVCAKICTACAESCETFKDDEAMAACAEACRKCAKSCEEMSKQQ
ncbi:MAG: four-helix bundle copper-binding protein [Bdellovibrionaceae bacterium]|nr:four-helix bundle copper-binding protein [Pseudobdellovibrionaceae bacterium]